MTDGDVMWSDEEDDDDCDDAAAGVSKSSALIVASMSASLVAIRAPQMRQNLAVG